jgi:hypothetical protein
MEQVEGIVNVRAIAVGFYRGFRRKVGEKFQMLASDFVDAYGRKCKWAIEADAPEPAPVKYDPKTHQAVQQIDTIAALARAASEAKAAELLAAAGAPGPDSVGANEADLV